MSEAGMSAGAVRRLTDGWQALQSDRRYDTRWSWMQIR